MLSEIEVTEVLKKVVDPELGINIVDLGLIYQVTVLEAQVTIKMTMTTPACPMHMTIIDNLKRELLGSDLGISKVEVDLVWEPAWKPELMSDSAREFLK
jgi:metal-sulfur cluster biosynthetic enzyme